MLRLHAVAVHYWDTSENMVDDTAESVGVRWTVDDEVGQIHW